MWIPPQLVPTCTDQMKTVSSRKRRSIPGWPGFPRLCCIPVPWGGVSTRQGLLDVPIECQSRGCACTRVQTASSGGPRGCYQNVLCPNLHVRYLVVSISVHVYCGPGCHLPVLGCVYGLTMFCSLGPQRRWPLCPPSRRGIVMSKAHL